MSIESVITTVGNDVERFYKQLSADFQKARSIWLLISSAQVRSVVLTIAADAVKLVKDTASAAESGGLSLPLDATVVADIKTFIADAKAGDGVIVSDLKVLGIVL